MKQQFRVEFPILLQKKGCAGCKAMPSRSFAQLSVAGNKIQDAATEIEETGRELTETQVDVNGALL